MSTFLRRRPRHLAAALLALATTVAPSLADDSEKYFGIRFTVMREHMEILIDTVRSSVARANCDKKMSGYEPAQGRYVAERKRFDNDLYDAEVGDDRLKSDTLAHKVALDFMEGMLNGMVQFSGIPGCHNFINGALVKKYQRILSKFSREKQNEGVLKDMCDAAKSMREEAAKMEKDADDGLKSFAKGAQVQKVFELYRDKEDAKALKKLAESVEAQVVSYGKRFECEKPGPKGAVISPR